MCLAIPLRIASIDGTLAVVEQSGVTLRISLALTPEAHVGDYVLVHTGYAISVLDQAEALETLALFDEIARAAERHSSGDRAEEDGQSPRSCDEQDAPSSTPLPTEPRRGG